MELLILGGFFDPVLDPFGQRLKGFRVPNIDIKGKQGALGRRRVPDPMAHDLCPAGDAEI